jgi:hypothetical protein
MKEMNKAIIQALALKAEVWAEVLRVFAPARRRIARGLRVQASDLLVQAVHEALRANDFESVNQIICDVESRVDTWWISTMCAILLVSKPWRKDVDTAWMKLHGSLSKRIELEGGPADIKQMLNNMLHLL